MRDLFAVDDPSADAAYKNIQSVRPGMKVFKVSAKNGEGMEDYFSYLSGRLAESRKATVC